jgi:hypothetical protein
LDIQKKLRKLQEFSKRRPRSKLTEVFRLQQAAADPSALTQETIIDNLDEVEKGRLARIRNIGIAVSSLPLEA